MQRTYAYVGAEFFVWSLLSTLLEEPTATRMTSLDVAFVVDSRSISCAMLIIADCNDDGTSIWDGSGILLGRLLRDGVSDRSVVCVPISGTSSSHREFALALGWASSLWDPI